MNWNELKDLCTIYCATGGGEEEIVFVAAADITGNEKEQKFILSHESYIIDDDFKEKYVAENEDLMFLKL